MNTLNRISARVAGLVPLLLALGLVADARPTYAQAATSNGAVAVTGLWILNNARDTAGNNWDGSTLLLTRRPRRTTVCRSRVHRLASQRCSRGPAERRRDFYRRDARSLPEDADAGRLRRALGEELLGHALRRRPRAVGRRLGVQVVNQPMVLGSGSWVASAASIQAELAAHARALSEGEAVPLARHNRIMEIIRNLTDPSNSNDKPAYKSPSAAPAYAPLTPGDKERNMDYLKQISSGIYKPWGIGGDGRGGKDLSKKTTQIDDSAKKAFLGLFRVILSRAEIEFTEEEEDSDSEVSKERKPRASAFMAWMREFRPSAVALVSR